MPKTTATSVRELIIDLKNFRTVAQADEMQAVQAMISVSPDKFWALMESLIDDGYLPTENIIVLEDVSSTRQLLVKEGNRRIAALKLIHGYLPSEGIPISDRMLGKIAALSSEWKKENEQVPCTIYSADDAAVVDKIVTLTHGKGESAGRDHWTAVARARHNRDFNKTPEHALDLLEKYLAHGENINKQQAKRWAGDYSLSVLDEAIGRIAARLGAKSGRDLARDYPAISNKSALDDILRDIGIGIITFPTIRSQNDFLEVYLPHSSGQAPAISATPHGPQTSSTATTASAGGGSSSNNGSSTAAAQAANSSAGNSTATTAQPSVSTVRKMAAVAIGDPRVVMRTLKKFLPLGNDRQKVVTLRDEAKQLKLEKNPMAFCFLLRSMFEISAKAYCADHKVTGGPSYKKSNGDDKTLAVVLRDITNHLTQNNADATMVKVLHGAMTELGRSDGILSVTSMNQLVHNPSFSVKLGDIAALFGNIFPLLEAMNS
jgi:hypothetical protein